jgi:hypothetical protein
MNQGWSQGEESRLESRLETAYPVQVGKNVVVLLAVVLLARLLVHHLLLLGVGR